LNNSLINTLNSLISRLKTITVQKLRENKLINFLTEALEAKAVNCSQS